MRRFQIEGTKAGFARLKMLENAPEYGLELRPEDTAPFNVIWHPGLNAGAVCVGKNTIAHVDTKGRTPEIIVRDEYPQEFDHLLVRALVNATAVTDTMSKMMKSEGTSKAVLFSQTHEKIRTGMDAATFRKAMLGAEFLDPRLRLSNQAPTRYSKEDEMSVEVTMGKATHSIGFKIIGRGTPDEDVKTDKRGYQSYSMKEEPFRRLLDKGLRVFESRFTPALFAAARADISLDLNAVDVPAIRNFFDLTNVGDVSDKVYPAIDCGRFSFKTHGYRYQMETDLMMNGIRIASRLYDVTDVAVPNSMGIESGLITSVFDVMRVRFEAACINATLDDFPKISKDSLADLVRDVDFGYSL